MEGGGGSYPSAHYAVFQSTLAYISLTDTYLSTLICSSTIFDVEFSSPPPKHDVVGEGLYSPAFSVFRHPYPVCVSFASSLGLGIGKNGSKINLVILFPLLNGIFFVKINIDN